MRSLILAALITSAAIPLTMAQNSAMTQRVPTAIGNRVDGNNYEPTPGEVIPREKATGILPSRAQQQQTNNELWRMDSKLLKSEGLSGRSVPDKRAPGT